MTDHFTSVYVCGVINYSYDAYMELNSIPHSDIMNSYSHQYKMYAGYFELPVSLLIEPTNKRLLRKVDQLFVKKLKAAMLENLSSDSAPIVAIVCLKDGEDFDASKSHTYHYETIISGNNSRQALQELNAECNHPLYRTRLVSVYKGLSDQQAR